MNEDRKIISLLKKSDTGTVNLKKSTTVNENHFEFDENGYRIARPINSKPNEIYPDDSSRPIREAWPIGTFNDEDVMPFASDRGLHTPNIDVAEATPTDLSKYMNDSDDESDSASSEVSSNTAISCTSPLFRFKNSIIDLCASLVLFIFSFLVCKIKYDLGSPDLAQIMITISVMFRLVFKFLCLVFLIKSFWGVAEEMCPALKAFFKHFNEGD